MKYILIALLFFFQVALGSTGIIGPALYEGQTVTVTSGGTKTLANDSETVQVFTGSSSHTLVLPDATTFPKVGKYYYVWNESSGTITIKKNGGATLTTVVGAGSTRVYNSDKSTAAGVWDVQSNAVDLSSTLVSGILPLSKGGTNKNMTAVAGGLVWTDSDSMEVTAAGTSGYFALSGGTGAPTWTLPSTAVISGLPSLVSGKFLTNNGTALSWADAGLATQAIQEGSSTTTTLLKVPSNQLTNIGSNTRLLETGNGNVLGDPGFERTSGSSPWSAVTWDGALSSGVDSSTNAGHADSLQSYKIVANADYSVAFLRQDVTPKGNYEGQLLEHGIWYKSSDAGMNYMWVCPRQGGTTLTYLCSLFLNLDGKWNYVWANSIGPAAGTSIGLVVYGTANMIGTTYVDDAYVGLNRRVSEVKIPIKLGSITFSGCGANWTTTSTTMTNLSAVSGCTITTKGAVQSPGSNIPGFKLNTIDAGSIRMEATGQFYRSTVAASTAVFRFSDGTKVTNNQSIPLGSATDSGVPGISGSIDYDTAVSSPTTIQIQAFTNAASNAAGIVSSLNIDVYYFPTTFQSIQSTNAMRPPTTTTLTAGSSATYNVPTGVARLEIEAVGGGGGGAGCSMSGAYNGGTGGPGGNTTFVSGATTLISATGGNAGSNGTVPVGGGGALGTITAPAYGPTPAYSAGGGAGMNTGSATTYAPGGVGASSILGGGAYGFAANGAGITASANSGGGGSGAATNAGTSASSGGGGAAGAYVKAYIDNPASSYTYTIGGGGGAGAAGTSCYAGGAGGSGKIIIREIYGINIPPMKAGVIAADNPGGVTTINTVVSKSADYTATINEDKIIMDSSGGTRTLSLPAAASVRGKEYLVINASNSNQTIIDPNGSETICGQTTVRLTGIRDKMRIFSDGTNWQSDDCEKRYRANVTCSSSSTIASQNGNMTLGNVSTGACTGTFLTGTFSTIWSCGMTLNGNSGGLTYGAQANLISSTSVKWTGVYNSGGSTVAETAGAWSIWCDGAR